MPLSIVGVKVKAKGQDAVEQAMEEGVVGTAR